MSVVTGPWPTLLQFFVSFDGGDTVRKVFGKSKAAVTADAAATIWNRLYQLDGQGYYEPTPEEHQRACDERLRVYTPEEWNAQCWCDHLSERQAALDPFELDTLVQIAQQRGLVPA